MDQKIKQTTGTCKYCGQSAMVKVPADWDQEQINDHVSENVCMCEEGAEPRYIKKTTEAAQDGLDILFAKEENDKAKDFLQGDQDEEKSDQVLDKAEELAKKALGNEKADQIAGVRDAIDAKIGNEGKK